jgi:hypothetical protein
VIKLKYHNLSLTVIIRMIVIFNNLRIVNVNNAMLKLNNYKKRFNNKN